jgi:hypothetical protein
MTIKELIKELSQYDGNRPVIGLDEHGDHRPVQIIEHVDPDDGTQVIFVSVD